MRKDEIFLSILIKKYFVVNDQIKKFVWRRARSEDKIKKTKILKTVRLEKLSL